MNPNENKVPPIISDWLEKINNKSNPLHVRDNIAMMLENVSQACSTAVSTYRNSKILQDARKRKNS